MDTSSATLSPIERGNRFMAAIRAAGIEYIKRGWSIFPLSIKTKKPLIAWKEYQGRQTTLAEWESWVTDGVVTESGARITHFNIGLVTGILSGLCVVDCDNLEALAYAEENDLTSGFRVATTRGCHFYFKHPNHDKRYTNKVGGDSTDWPNLHGLDFRGDGGFVVAPPSTRFDPETNQHLHTYEWTDAELLDWSELPLWQGAPTLQEATTPFNFASVSLGPVSLVDSGVAGQLRATLPRPDALLGEGSGRNQWLTKYAGEKVREGYTGKALRELCSAFQHMFFSVPLPDAEFERTLRSVAEIDQRNHRDQYDQRGRRIVGIPSPEPIPPSPTPALKPIPTLPSAAPLVLKPLFASDISTLLARAGEQRFYIEPFVAAGTITQVIGSNGSGKTYILMNALWSAACGKDFCGYKVFGSPSVLYFDFELSSTFLADRMAEMLQIHGDPGERFMLWSKAIHARETGEINLRTPEGLALFEQWIKGNPADIIVIDTVRSALPGMDECDVSHWAHLNQVMKRLRDAGKAVLFVHHKTKPTIHGPGRESGSNAQLTDVDYQLDICKVAKDKRLAQLQVAMNDADTQTLDLSGRAWTAHKYLEKKATALKADNRIRFVAQLKFGKVRQHTPLHSEIHYLGVAESLADASHSIIGTMSYRQKAARLQREGKTITNIANLLDLPVPYLTDMLK